MTEDEELDALSKLSNEGPYPTPRDRAFAAWNLKWHKYTEIVPDDYHLKPRVRSPMGEPHDRREHHLVYTEGGRNNSLTRIAGILRRFGCSYEVIYAALLGINEGCCTPPLSNREVEGVARSISRYLPPDQGAKPWRKNESR